MIALLLVRQRAVKNHVDLPKKKKEIKEGVAIGAFRSIFFLPFFQFCYRHCGSVKVKLVLNFSKKLYTIQNCKVMQSIYSVFLS